jgi:hypothetical protein
MTPALDQPKPDAAPASFAAAHGSPARVQLSRRRGFRMPPNTVKVARPTKWGNPFKVGDDVPGLPGIKADRLDVVHYYEVFLPIPLAEIKRELRGKNLACFCPLDQPCHADVLLRLANERAQR